MESPRAESKSACEESKSPRAEVAAACGILPSEDGGMLSPLGQQTASSVSSRLPRREIGNSHAPALHTPFRGGRERVEAGGRGAGARMKVEWRRVGAPRGETGAHAEARTT